MPDTPFSVVRVYRIWTAMCTTTLSTNWKANLNQRKIQIVNEKRRKTASQIYTTRQYKCQDFAAVIRYNRQHKVYNKYQNECLAQADTKVTDSTGVELKERKIIIRINLVQAWKGNAIRMCPVTSNKKQELLPEHLSIAIFWLLHNYRGKLLDKSKRGVEQINRTRKNEKSFKHPRRSIMRKCFVSRYKANAAATLEYISIHSSSCTLMQKATGHLCKARITSMDFKCARQYT